MQSTKRSLLGRFASAIHPPLPLDPARSKLLLQALTKSFQRHLDESYPPRLTWKLSKEYAEHGRPSSSSAFARASSFQVADKHFGDIITHPVLFSQYEPSLRQGTPLNPKLDEWSQSALRVVKEHLAKGTLNKSTLAVSLKGLENVIRTVDDPDPSQRPELASRILSWTIASNQITLPEILSDGQCSEILITLLVWEGRTDIIWSWICNSDVQITNLLRLRIVRRFIRVNMRERGLAPGMQEFLVAVQHFTAVKHRKELRNCLFEILDFMLHNPAVVQKIDISLYDKFVVAVRGWGRHMSSGAVGIVSLLHPQSPSTEDALAHLSYQLKSPKFQTWSQSSKKTREHYVALGLRLSHQLIQEKRYDDAQFVLENTAQNFPLEVGVWQDDLPARAKAKKAPSSQENQTVLEQLDTFLAL